MTVTMKSEAMETDAVVTLSAALEKMKAEKKRLEEDYQKTKKDLEFVRHSAARAESDFLRMKQKYEDAREQVEALKLKVGASTEATKAERDIQFFTTATNDYIRRHGGHVWAFNEIHNVNETVRTDYLKAIKALDAFAQQMIKNIEGGIL